MKQDEHNSQPTIVKYVEPTYAGIHMLKLSRCAIGYVTRGTKYVYYGDARYTISKGEVFYMGVGNHYVEEVMEDGRPFEEIVVYYTPEQLQRILLHLNELLDKYHQHASVRTLSPPESRDDVCRECDA